MSEPDRTAVTYRYECWRAIPAGVIEAASTTFLLLIAVRFYHAGPLAKSLVAGGGSLGFVLAPWLVSRVEALGWPVALAASRLAALGAASFLLMALLPFELVFVLGSVLALTTSTAAIPLLTQIYQENYPEAGRGRRFSRTVMIRIAAAAAFSYLAGWALSDRLDRFRWLLVLFGVASAWASFCLARCPSRPLASSGRTHPFHAFRFIRSDRLFRQTIISWMFLGFGILMMVPLRVEYLANPKYGVTLHGETLSVGMIALVTAVIPNLTRLALNPAWGWLFDHKNFFVLRISLNFGFTLGILAFFATGSVAGLVIGAIAFGISNAGGDIAWSLWVTKFAPPERVAEYMSVHTFFTGIRGMLAPLVAFQFAASLSLAALGWISAGLILAASCFLIPEIRFGKSARAASALVEEIGE
jgi:MFS family permease